MNFTRAHLRGISAAFALLFCALIILYVERPHTPKHKNGLINKAPSWYATDIHLRDYDLDGKPKTVWSAQHMVHDPNLKETKITLPHFERLPLTPGEFTYTVDAKSGTAHHGNTLTNIEQLELFSDVVLLQTNNPAPAAFKTEFLRIFPNTNIVKTDAAVKIQKPGHIMTGLGFIADLNSGTAKILSQVRGTHERAH